MIRYPFLKKILDSNREIETKHHLTTYLREYVIGLKEEKAGDQKPDENIYIRSNRTDIIRRY